MPGGRGGRRTGKVGKAYSNRSDLQGGKLPATAVPGQAYGQAGAQLAAQQAVPMGTPQVAGGPPAPLPADFPTPGSLGSLTDPSQNPDEHVMNGSPMGPGGGPESIGLAMPGSGQLDPTDAQTFARWLPALTEIASRPDSTAGTRQLVRLLRSRISQVG